MIVLFSKVGGAGADAGAAGGGSIESSNVVSNSIQIGEENLTEVCVSAIICSIKETTVKNMVHSCNSVLLLSWRRRISIHTKEVPCSSVRRRRIAVVVVGHFGKIMTSAEWAYIWSKYIEHHCGAFCKAHLAIA